MIGMAKLIKRLIKFYRAYEVSGIPKLIKRLIKSLGSWVYMV
ncbi:hypothetical protein BACCIP111895_01727 [Neobacillus rhizosphaerae]|uniref:Maturase n=1 Tax=Neobacillus rhizosphaerae TaxID=2880965 RepID=A0ABM9EPL2_9BACI|nr:hypothetical protein BACCIP111895_01727 [Neobacillus rhizosphaerae]